MREDEAKEVIKIPIPSVEREDRLVWHYHRRGAFTVRSAYYLELQDDNDLAETSHGKEKLIWKKCWNSNTLPKIKNFVWRALQNGLPVRENLKRRNITREDWCPRCGEEPESGIHMIGKCDIMQKLWYYSPLRLIIPDGV